MFYVLAAHNCPWCTKATELLDDNGLRYEYHKVLDHVMLIKLLGKAGLRTVPQIWHNNEYIGGYTDLVTWLEENGKDFS